MDSIPKPFTEEETLDSNDNNGEDIISNLPDGILAHILSKLPTKYAVGTAILSTRWKHLFPTILQLNLDFDDSLILHPENNVEANSEKRMTSFSNFTYRVLDVILDEVFFIDRFTLKCTNEYQDEQYIDWIYGALERCVRILDIDTIMIMDSPVLLFELISGWRSLFGLALRTNVYVEIPSSFSLPNLKYLLLHEIEFDDDEVIPLLLSGCPVLQKLVMRYCRLSEVITVNISSSSLTRLSFERCWYTERDGVERIELDCPALEEFYFEDYVPTCIVVKNLNSLCDVDISIIPMEGLDEEQYKEYNKYTFTFVSAFSNVKTLFLSSDTISAFQKSGEQVPLFCNLTGLHLGGFDTNGWKLLPQLLEKAPILELLSITKEFYEEKGFEVFTSHHMPDKIPTCLLSTLKKIQIFKLKGELEELCLTRYLLRTGKVLKEFEVMCVSGLPMEKYFLVRELLASLPTLSETCKILFYDIK